MKIHIGRDRYLSFSVTTLIGADPATWLGILWRYGRGISWPFIPKAIMLTWLVLLNTPLVWWERLRYDRRIRRAKVTAPLFIIGHQRSACDLNEIHQLAIDLSGNKWFVTSNQATGVLVFNEGNLETNGDERCRIISQSNSKMPSNVTNCVSVDLDGDVWVGTAQGVVIFECGDPFNVECVGTIRSVERNGFLGELLATEDVLTIAVDGADRKWVGTRNGYISCRLPERMKYIILRLTIRRCPTTPWAPSA